MSNFTFENLLTYSPFEALLIAFNETHGTALNPRFVALDKVVSANAGMATVRIKAIPYSVAMGTQIFTGQCDIDIKRIDLGYYFPRGYVIPGLDQMTSHDVARVIESGTGVVFDKSDFESDVITPTNNVLKASADSLRWYGQIEIHKG